MKVPDIFIPEKDLGQNIESLLKVKRFSIPEYKIIKSKTYAKGIAKLKEQGKMPFTFAENIEARIIDYTTNCEDAELFRIWLDSVTGIAYKAKSTKFKLILRSDKLENIKSVFSRNFVPVEYSAEKGIEFDSRKGKYNQNLTREEAKSHKFWLELMNGNKERLAEYVDIWFDKTGKEKGMGIFLRNNTTEDELYSLPFDFYGDSDANGNSILDYKVRFIFSTQ